MNEHLASFDIDWDLIDGRWLSQAYWPGKPDAPQIGE
jgi:hypothetical protein